MTNVEYLLTGAAVLLVVAVVASKVSSRLGIPALLLFLAIGMLAGSDGPGGIWFDNAGQAQSLGVVALALILFSGGLETQWPHTASSLWPAVSLATIGVGLTALIMGLAAHLLLGFTPLQGLLLGAIVSSTDAAAVFSVLRAQRLNLAGRIQPLLELESGSNDPMAAFLTIAFAELLSHQGARVVGLLPLFVEEMVLGAIFGFVIGWSALFLINRLRLDGEGLYPVLTLAVALLAYGVPASCGGSGFLAVYITGLVMGNQDFLHKRSLIRFHGGVAWLMQIVMFLTLGLLVFPSHLPSVAMSGTILALCLVFVARPVSVFASLALSSFTAREKMLISWVGLRGAVPIVLATFPLVAGLPQSALYFDVVFFIVVASVLLQGTTISPVARWLQLISADQPPLAPALEFAPSATTTSDLFEVSIPPSAGSAGRQLIDLHLPKSALVVLLTRGEKYLIPRGGTVVEPGDRLLVLAERVDKPVVVRVLQQEPFHQPG